jgi:DNA repair protein RecN (Recombination protein N)
MPSAALSEEVARRYPGSIAWRDSERTLKKHREKVEAAAREADYLRLPSRN